MRTCSSVTCRSKSRAMRPWQRSLTQFILVSARLLRWYPVRFRHRARPRYFEDRFVARPCSRCVRLPQFGVLAWCDDRMGVSGRNRFMALTCVVCSICGNGGYLLIGWDLFQQAGQHRRIADVAGSDLNRADLQCFLIHSEVELAPKALFGPPMFGSVPFVTRQAHTTHAAERAPSASALIPFASISRCSGPVPPR